MARRDNLPRLPWNRCLTGKARDVREAYREGATQAELARRYQVSEKTIGECVRGETYKDEGGPIARPWRDRPGILRAGEPGELLRGGWGTYFQKGE